METNERKRLMPVLSVRLMAVLDHLGASETIRRRRRQITKDYETISTAAHSGKTRYLFGSQAEGTTIPGLGSDIDYLKCDEQYKVIQSLDDWRQGYENLLMTRDDCTRAGYVKLWRCKISSPQPSYGSRSFADYLSDTLDRLMLHHKRSVLIGGDEYNGPALTQQHLKCYTSVDKVVALRCDQFPEIANQWLMRERHYNWPSDSCIARIRNNGCFLVPVGHPFSEEQELEWKVSFAFSERELIWSLNEIQFKCYVMLKVILKSFFKPYMVESISSYHCKTCILYISESTPGATWTPDNLLYCLSLCLNQILSWINAGSLPHFFMPDHDLFEHKVHGDVRVQARAILQQLISEEFDFLLQIDFCNIGQLMKDACNNINLHTMRLSVCGQVYMEFGSFVGHSGIKAIAAIQGDISREALDSKTAYDLNILCSKVIAMLRHIYGGPVLYILKTNVLAILGIAVASSDPMHFLSPNHSELFATTTRIAVNSISLDAMSIQLKLAAKLLCTGNAAQALLMLDVLEETQHNIELTACGESFVYNPYFVGKTFLEGAHTIFSYTRQHVKTCVVYFPAEIDSVPECLQYEMFRPVGGEELTYEQKRFGRECVAMDADTYLPLLQYLCYRQMGNNHGKRKALQGFLDMTHSERYLCHRQTALNVLGHQSMLE